MRQVIQELTTGKTVLAEVPQPVGGPGQLLIETSRSLISAGTERMLVEFGKSNLLEKARQQPDKVKQVIEKAKTDGLLATYDSVRAKLDEPIPLGYCNAGCVLNSGFRIPNSEFEVGDRVASNGHHAGLVAVPQNLCAKIPDGVSDEQGSFTVISAIALQGVRLVQPTFGESIVVYGLGLIGLISVQLLRSSGCRVLGIDFNEQRLGLAERFGAEVVHAGKSDPVAAASSWTRGKGVDGVLITASAKTDEIVHNSAEMCRKRGRIVLVGVVGLNLRRADFYEKELSFQVSCSYGPGRYDPSYEEEGHDYPYGYVRWTEQRNMEAALEAIRKGQLVVDDLITHRVAFADAVEAYELILNDPTALGVILEYEANANSRIDELANSRISEAGGEEERSGGRNSSIRQSTRLGVIGAGSFAKGVLLPALAKTGADIGYVADVKPVAAAHAVRRFGAGKAATDYTEILNDPSISAVLIAVRHHLHARLVCEALEAGKHVFVEKPLCLNVSELQQVCELANFRDPDLRISESETGEEESGEKNSEFEIRNPAFVSVGFNRRFSHHTVHARKLLEGRVEPLAMNVTVNAGAIPADHWTQDPKKGGGRIIGEACHFIDLMVFLARSKVVSVAANQIGGRYAECRMPSAEPSEIRNPKFGIPPVQDDKMSILLAFADGSIGTVNYFANGSKAYPKETVEIFSDGRVVRIENFRRTRTYGFRKIKKTFTTFRQDKGHQAQFEAFVDSIENGSGPLIPFGEIVNVTLASFAAVTSARERRVVDLEEFKD